MSIFDTVSVLGVVSRPLLYLYTVVSDIFDACHLGGVWEVSVLVVMVVRFVLKPIVGNISVGIGSDTVSTSRRSFKNDVYNTVRKTSGAR